MLNTLSRALHAALIGTISCADNNHHDIIGQEVSYIIIQEQIATVQFNICIQLKGKIIV